MCKAHIALQEHQAIAMVLHRMVSHLSGKVVALHLDNSTVKAYLCNQGGTVSPFFLVWLAWILSPTDKHGIVLDGGSLASHSSQHVGRHSSAVPHHKRPHCGCLSRPGTQGSAIFAFIPLAAQQCVLCRQGFSSSVCQVVVG